MCTTKRAEGRPRVATVACGMLAIVEGVCSISIIFICSLRVTAFTCQKALLILRLTVVRAIG